jgi:hypothetical protein
MTPDLGEWWWVPIVAAAIGGFLVPILGYYRRPKNGNGKQSTISGTAIIDSSVARDMLAQLAEQVIQTRRLADSAEGLLKIEQAREVHLERRREAEREDAIRERDALRRKLDAQERGKR